MSTMDELYPEHAKLMKVSEESQAVGMFLEWLGGERHLYLGEFGDADNPDDERSPHRLYPATVNIQELLAEFFDIDRNKIETEKRAMLEALRAG